MKKLILTALAITLTALLAACHAGQNVSQLPKSCEYKINGVIIDIHSYKANIPPKDNNMIFRSRQRLDNFIHTIVEVSYNNPNLIINQSKKYTNDWFKENILYYTTIQENSGSVIYTPKNIVKKTIANGKQAVEINIIRNRPDQQTCNMAYYCMFIEIRRNEIENISDENFSLHFVDTPIAAKSKSDTIRWPRKIHVGVLKKSFERYIAVNSAEERIYS